MKTPLNSRLSISVLAVLVIATTAWSVDDDSTWSDKVWQAAMDGEREKVDALLQEVPDSAGADVHRTAYRDQYLLWKSHQARTAEAVQAKRQEAAEEMRKAMEEDRLLDALRSAVEFQTLSNDYDAVLRDETVIGVIKRSERELPGIIAEGDWLYAQEILFRLRTLYEDTQSQDRWDHFDSEMEPVGQRLGLLRRYARENLYALYVKRNARVGEDPPQPFNSQLSDRWKQEVARIDGDMVRKAFQIAATEHVSSKGWSPLYEGGFDSLAVLSQTPALATTFPGLGDAESVEKWHKGIDRLEQDISIRLDAGQSPRMVAETLFSELEAVNDRTIDIPEAVLWREFGDGGMEELDPYTSIIWPYDIEEFNRQMEGKFIGVGIMISETEVGDIKVVYPLEGKPAYYAGVQPDDIIVEVDGNSTAGWTVQDAVHHITGDRFARVVLGVKREGAEEIIKIPIVRDEIKMHSIKGWRKDSRNDHGDPVWDWYIDPGSHIAYIKLTQFSEDTFRDLGIAFEEMYEAGEPRGLILDLRHNPGGLLTSAYQIGDLFVSNGSIVTGEDKDGQQSFDLDAHRGNTALGDLPTVVLVNKGSASASEIVSGCLQAHEAGLVIGQRSFGKGSVQTVHNVTYDAKLKCTTQYYRLPPGITGEEGRLVDKEMARKFEGTDWGVVPDLEVRITPDQIEESLTLRLEADRLPGDPPRPAVAGEEVEESTTRPDIDELIERGLDPQLELALLILQARCLEDQAGDVDGLPHASLPASD